MLQQTQVKTVIPYWERWLRELPTVQSTAKAPPAKLHKLWEGLGYYTRVRNLQKAAQQIVAQHHGKFSERFDDILALPGIGRYTAGAIASIAFNQPHPILDGNVIRVLTRIFGIRENPRDKETNARLWQLAGELVTKAASERPATSHFTFRSSHFNQSLMELGALICTPRAPRCDICPVAKLCIARKDNLQEQLPNLDKRAETTARRFLAFVVEHDGKYLVRQRPDGAVNGHLWEFPNTEILGTPSPLQAVASDAGFRLSAEKPLHIIKHTITRYRITLEAYRAQAANEKLIGRWLSLAQLRRLAFSSAHKRILTQLQTAARA